MYRLKIFLMAVVGLSFLSFGITYAQTEIEPNDSFATATLLLDNTTPTAIFSSSDDVDIWRMEMSTDSIYHIYSHDANTPKAVQIEMFFGDDTTTNILDGDPSGRGRGPNFRIAGWVPFEYGSGTYYIKLSHAEPITGEFTGDYKVRLISQNLDYWANLHEPDNSFQEAFGQLPLPIDGTRFNGCLYNLDDLPTGKNDVDFFYMAGEQGKRLWVETVPVQGYPHTRDIDSYLWIWDGDGNNLLTENDDKHAQEEDNSDPRWFAESNNGFSLCVIDSLPYTGLYYVVVTSYFSEYNGEVHSDEDPSTGGYVLYSFMGDTKNEVEPNNTFETATPICDGLNGAPDDVYETEAIYQVRGDNNIVIDANFSSDSDVDYYAFNLKITKWYTFNTTNSSVAEEGDIMLEVYSRDDPGTNLIDDSVEGGYKSEDFRLSGWSPPVDGIYILKVSPAPGSVGGENTGDYQLRMGYACWRKASLVGEPDNDQQGGAVEVDYDNSNTYAAIYPAGDEDWFSFSGTAGDIIHVETFSGLDWDGTWGRDLDTEITLVDPSGNVVENDDYRPGEDRHFKNGFSAIVDYTLQGSGLVHVKVKGYYDNNDDDGDNAIGTYRLFVYSSAASPEFLELEPNDTFAGAMQIPEGKDVISTFSSATDIDVFSVEMVTSRMYFVNSKDNTTAEDIHAEFFAASDTLTDLLDSDIDNRYKNYNFRLSGFIPPADGVYYMKLSCTDPGQGGYTVRARSADIAEVGSFHEPDNTISEANALGDYPIDGVTMTGALYNKDDAEFEHDLDIYRFNCTAGQMFVAETTPVGGPTWHRDTDTFIQLVNAAGDTIAENDDVVSGNSFATLAETIPADGVYYLKIMSYSSSEGDEPTHRNPGVGDYLLTVKGTMSESEPNNSAAEANPIPVSDNNLIEASFAVDDLEDWFKIALEQEKLYYFNSTDSKVAEDIMVEVFAEGTQTNLIDGTPFDEFDSNDFRICGWSPPATGTYLFKLSVPISAIDANNTGEYKLRAAGGEVLAEVAALHEPDNSMEEADQQAALSTDGTPFETAFGDKDDHDMFAINGIEGNSLEIVTAPAHGLRWIRDLDTVMDLYDANGTVLDDNDDYEDWYELDFYIGEVGNNYSRIFIESLPATGTYYIDVYPYYGSYNEEESAIGKSAVGSYKVWAKMSSTTGIDETEQVPKVFALEQNYPNPFNPITTIQYSLAEPVLVKLVIYNIMGQKVVTLVDAPQMSGRHKIIWDTKDEFGVRVSAGLYIYQLIAGDKFVKTKKMLLIK